MARRSEPIEAKYKEHEGRIQKQVGEGLNFTRKKRVIRLKLQLGETIRLGGGVRTSGGPGRSW